MIGLQVFEFKGNHVCGVGARHVLGTTRIFVSCLIIWGVIFLVRCDLGGEGLGPRSSKQCIVWVFFLSNINIWNFRPRPNKKDGMRWWEMTYLHRWTVGLAKGMWNLAFFSEWLAFWNQKLISSNIFQLFQVVPNNGDRKFLWGFAVANVMCRVSWESKSTAPQCHPRKYSLSHNHGSGKLP